MLRGIVSQSVGDSHSKNKHGSMKVPDNWRDPQTFIVALEKVEAWMFSRIVESVWWQVEFTPKLVLECFM